MSRNHAVFSLLITKGNQAPLVKDKTVMDLLPGQIGVFDADTNISIDKTVTGGPRNFYLAVGVDDGTGALGDIIKSTGTHVQARNIKYYNFRPHTAGQAMKVKVKDYVAQCETEYGIKIEFRNQEIYKTQGFVGYTKTFNTKTSCCEKCKGLTCPSADANEVTKGLYYSILNDESKLLKVFVKHRASSKPLPTGVTPDANGNIKIEDVDKIIAYNKTKTDPKDWVYTDLELETVPQKINDFCAVHMKYMYPRQTFVVVSKAIGFECTGAVEVTQEAVFEEGAGIDIKQLEYFAKGLTESPYRVSAITGFPDEKVYLAKADTTYDQFVLGHDLEGASGGWGHSVHNFDTIVAVPEADTATRNGLSEVLDVLIKKVELKSIDAKVKAANTDPAVIEKTSV